MAIDATALIELESYDREIAKLEKSKKEFPKRVMEMEATLLEKGALLSVAKEKLEECQKDIEKANRELEENKNGLATSHDRINLVKTNKEYDAILLEISERKDMIERGNKRLKKLNEKLVTLQENLDIAQKEFDEITAELQPQIDDLKLQIGSIDDDIKKVVEKRVIVEEKIDPIFLDEYNIILSKRKTGRVLSIINNQSNTCGYCYQILNPKIMKEAKESLNKPIICENCGSIMVWQNIEPTESADEEVE